ncbi:unnamed protein product [Candidula unifasciata]|uniref:Fanconi anemia complementation group L n=1 Tax=Candidula unifasciata TaxID=100452 RepID=A0A8S3ZP06_9EUPU|nr:unnamed protein product [Candidula unifasciata]
MLPTIACDMSLVEEFPLIIPSITSDGVCKYSGFISICGHSYRICVLVPGSGDLSSSRLECEWNLQHRLCHKTSLIQQRLQKSKNLVAFLKDFALIAETCLKNSSTEPEVWLQHSSHILQQIQELGWENIKNIGEGFSCVELGLHDTVGRWHSMKVIFNKQVSTSRKHLNYNSTQPPLCDTSLPEKFDFHWSEKTRLKHVFQQFEAAVQSHQLFWNIMKEIDSSCWVLDPEHPTFASTYRRIALGPNISLQITVNCRQPTTLPECRFLGSESVIAELREKLNVNLHRWDIDRSLLNNLQEVLDMDFPSPTDTRKEELTVDCGICYCHCLSDQVPEVVCEDRRCAQAFHRSCLYEWLRNLSCKQSFNTLFGECPLCSHPIRVKIPAG